MTRWMSRASFSRVMRGGSDGDGEGEGDGVGVRPRTWVAAAPRSGRGRRGPDDVPTKKEARRTSCSFVNQVS